MRDTITVTGNIATDPEHRTLPNGATLTSFRVASTEQRFDRSSNQWIDAHTNWFTISAFRGLAEHAARSLHKGDPVVVTGRLRVRSWDNGTARGTAVDIEADAIGHDLRWGTSSFERRSRSGAPSASQDSWATAEPDAGVDSDSSPRADGEWSVPGASSEADADAAAQTGDDAEAIAEREPELAGAGAAF